MKKYVIFVISISILLSQKVDFYNQANSRYECAIPSVGTNWQYSQAHDVFGPGPTDAFGNAPFHSNTKPNATNSFSTTMPTRQEGTIEMWIKSSNWMFSNQVSTDGNFHLIFAGLSNTYPQAICHTGEALHFSIGADRVSLTTFVLPTNTWMHVAFVWKTNAFMQIYTNEVLAASAAGPVPHGAYGYIQGNYNGGTTLGFGGWIDNPIKWVTVKTNFSDRYTPRPFPLRNY